VSVDSEWTAKLLASLKWVRESCYSEAFHETAALVVVGFMKYPASHPLARPISALALLFSIDSAKKS